MERRLYRSKRDRLLFGVCGGLGEYFNIDPVIIRVIFIIAIFFGGLGILAYIILAIVVPSENSVSNEPSRTIRENVQEMKETAETMGKDVHSLFSSSEKKPESTVTTPTPHRRSNTALLIGLIILVIGILLLIGTISTFFFSWRFWTYFWPAILIVVGLLIIIGRRR